jgi:hypothetical protein
MNILSTEDTFTLQINKHTSLSNLSIYNIKMKAFV